MIKKEIKELKLSPEEALKRIKSIVSFVVVGPSASGKSTLIYKLIDGKIVQFISDGIGDKSQTTIIPCTFLFDERIEEGQFGIKTNTKIFAFKSIHIELIEQLAILFSNNGGCTEDTLECIDDEWIDKVLEPKSAAYHLGKMKQEISLDKLKEALEVPLDAIENADKPFLTRVNDKKKELKSQKVKITEVRRIVFEEMWDELSSEVKSGYFGWIKSIEIEVNEKLNVLFENNIKNNNVFEFSVNEDDNYPNGGYLLKELFNPYNPYSLVVDQIILACRPRQEIIDIYKEDKESDIPLRFCLKDTMGLNQKGIDHNTIKDALDIALSSTPDSILLLLSLEERDDVIAESCDAISNKMKRVEKMDIPVNIFFTKADRILENMICKNNKTMGGIEQQDYDKNIEDAIGKMEASIKSYLNKIPQESSTWLSLIFKEEKIDPIQIALKNVGSNYVERFTPKGLYSNINRIIEDAQSRIFPDGINSPLKVQVIDYDKPAISFSVNSDCMKNEMDNIETLLAKDKKNVNRYLITTDYRIHGRSVVNYYRNLQSGQGYKTNAKVYGNFNINMKLMIYNTLCECIDFENLYKNQAILTDTSNIGIDEANKIINKIINKSNKEIDKKDSNGDISKFTSYVNPSISDKDVLEQVLHVIFKDYFSKTEKYHMIMNYVAFQLSYDNKRIKEQIDNVYMKPISYDQTIREMQETFRDIFSTEEFKKIIAEEIGSAMTMLVNKMFITI